LEGITLGVGESSQQPVPLPTERSLEKQIEHYLSQTEILKKPNTHRKYEAVLNRFAKEFRGRTVESVTVEQLNEFIVALMRRGMSANTVLHNVIIICQFFRRNGRPGLTRELHLPEKISTLPREYSEEDLEQFFGACDSFENAMFSTFLLTGMREQEVMYLYWTDLNLRLRTVRVTAKPDRGFYPKRWEEREIPVPSELVNLRQTHTRTASSPFVFPSPRGNREQNMLLRCKDVAERAGIAMEFDLKTFRSICDANAPFRIRRAHSTALDGTQVA
jgi:site-specific recombinase XerD